MAERQPLQLPTTGAVHCSRSYFPWAPILPVVMTVLGWAILIRGMVLLFLRGPATAHQVEWFHFDEFFYLYLGFAAAVGISTIHGLSWLIGRCLGSPDDRGRMAPDNGVFRDRDCGHPAVRLVHGTGVCW